MLGFYPDMQPLNPLLGSCVHGFLGFGFCVLGDPLGLTVASPTWKFDWVLLGAFALLRFLVEGPVWSYFLGSQLEG